MTDWREVVEQHGQIVWQTAYRHVGVLLNRARTRLRQLLNEFVTSEDTKQGNSP
ncbi:hypothetical protein [Novipirellula artificiosorum]|uniref:Uncharacterized protein n=1 Tax=Novipirellula artificiosorum TaxID=2528016 RepID=A0A5C6D3M0_9BACT|nr:hypothetical protein [Novipirellula artificiosorum]TWU31400.1 hypothetical protein Poly41_62690 [Novipirellula artificiosorum]